MKYLLLSLLLFTMACSKNENSVSSDDINRNANVMYDPNGYALIECSRFFAKQGNINGSIRVFRHNNIYYPDKVDVKFHTSVDLHNKVLMFYRWKQESNGQFMSDTNPLRFDVDVGGHIYTGFTSLTSTNPNETNLNQVYFTVHGTDIGYHALQVALYDNLNGNLIAYSDALIPYVFAHPNQYKASHANQNLLLALHPYMSQLNSSVQDEDFALKSYSDFCF